MHASSNLILMSVRKIMSQLWNTLARFSHCKISINNQSVHNTVIFITIKIME
jgi:galactitol-specific phosphotransferase system IIB component